MANDVIITDGSLSFGGGVDAVKVPTVASVELPDGLARNQLAWAVNATMRDGGATQRYCWQPKGTIYSGAAIFQGKFLYEPRDGSSPYHIVAIGGHIYKVDPDFAAPPVDLSVAFGKTLPVNLTHYYFCQAEEFLIIQAGDSTTKPLFWDGATLTQSAGFIGAADAGNQIPPATCMCYYAGRVWYAVKRTFCAGDIVGGPSGSAPYKLRDAVLYTTENPVAAGGDGFSVPSNAGDIRAMAYTAQLDASLGQGPLYVFTRKQVYKLTVPVTRTDWIAATATNQPQLTVAQINFGAVNDRSVVHANGDLFYQSMEPGIRSLFAAIRYFNQWANTQISSNESRVIGRNDRGLLQFASGIVFDNRLLQTALPAQTSQGVIHKALLPLDFNPISSFNRDTPPVWEGNWEGLDIMQLTSGDFGGLERAFAVVLAPGGGQLDLWELTHTSRFENGDNRLTWVIELPAYTFNRTFDLKKLVAGEIWFDRLWGKVDFEVFFRPDQFPCWTSWHKWSACAARNVSEDMNSADLGGYPSNYREQYRATQSLPLPPTSCNLVMERPLNVGYQFQMMIKVTGFCRVRGFLAKAQTLDKALYANMAK